jgi:hypothetical protein
MVGSSPRLARFALTLAAAAASMPSSAVSVDPRGLGQVLLFPYYTVRSAASGTYSTLFSIANTTDDAKVVRVRFREGRNGRDVTNFDVYLAPNDSWAAAVVDQANGAGLITNDASCTNPPLAGATPTVSFNNYAYSGASADGADTSLDRTREGYFEVFDLGVVRDPAVLAALQQPRDCTAARAVRLSNGTSITTPTGGLMGSASIVNVGAGTLYGYDAVALTRFTAVPLYGPVPGPQPALSEVNPKTSRVLDADGAHDATWDVSKGANPADPVSAVLMADRVLNTYVLDPVTQSGTDWVVTMPTKTFYVPTGNAAPTSLFEHGFTAAGAADDFDNVADCVSSPLPTYGTNVFDREGRTPRGQCFVLPPAPLGLDVPWTANVLTFNGSRVLGSALSTDVGTLFPNGWMKISPYDYGPGSAHRLVSTDTPPVVIHGLPMIGFMANDYVNGTLMVDGRNVLSNYSATSVHRYTVRME